MDNAGIYYLANRKTGKVLDVVKTAKNSFLQSIAIYVIFMNIKKEQPPTRG